VIGMAKILVAGGHYEDELNDARNTFASFLGKQIIARGHVLLGGCRTWLDATVATAAYEAARERKLNPKKVIKSWVSPGEEPSYDKGEIVKSQVNDWSQVPRRYAYPEPIKQADVVIVVGGWDGTHYAASWARLANKPLLPVAAFGLAALEIYQDELADFDRRYGARLSLDEYQLLNRFVGKWSSEEVDGFAEEVLSLAERMILSEEVFVIMSFAERGDLVDAYSTFRRVCKGFGLRAFKIDDHLDAGKRIVPNILDAIRRCAFVIADVSDPRPNVYYELGFAQALGKDVIVTARAGTELPFDIFDIPTQYWDHQGALEDKLRARLSHMGYKHKEQTEAS
jgi:hypothetical protein